MTYPRTGVTSQQTVICPTAAFGRLEHKNVKKKKKELSQGSIAYLNCTLTIKRNKTSAGVDVAPAFRQSHECIIYREVSSILQTLGHTDPYSESMMFT